MSDITESDLPLSVVIATVNEPDLVIRNSQQLLQQVNSVNGELLIVSNVDATRPPPAGVRVHQVPGGSVFHCRAAAVSLARGVIIAFTEDHCLHPPDWCERIVQTFSLQTDLIVLGGAVDNGSSRRIEDLINYWTTFATYAPGQVIAIQPCIAQFIVKASAIPRLLEPGELECRLIQKLAKLPGAIYIDPGLVVKHIQSHGFWNTFAVHYHNGRASSGFSMGHDSHKPTLVKSLWWICKDLGAHLRRCHTAFKVGGRSFPVRWMYLVMILPSTISHCLGALVGYRHGAGSSPYRLV